MPGISSLIVAGVILYIGYRTSLLRFYLVALFCLLSGIMLSISGLDNTLALGYFYLLAALSLVTAGLLTLRRYLKQTLPLEN
jgi:hypothetical protein